MDMYDRIQRQPARRQHITPGAAVLAAFGFLVAATCVGMLVYAARYQLRYRRFINDFSASLAASNKMSLHMTWQDEDVPITTDQASRLCRRITTAGEGAKGRPRWRRMPTRFWRWRFADHVAGRYS